MERSVRLGACVSLLCLCGCAGYHFVEVGGAAPSGLAAVTLWEDRGDEPGLGAACARALRARLGPPPAPGESAWVVRGAVLGVEERPVAAVGESVEVELSLTLSLRAARGDGAPAWESAPRTFTEQYRAAGATVEVSASRRAALRALCAHGAEALAWEMWEALEAPQGE